jgi:hypothetical protein
VKNQFQSLPFKRNLQRYTEAEMVNAGTAITDDDDEIVAMIKELLVRVGWMPLLTSTFLCSLHYTVTNLTPGSDNRTRVGTLHVILQSKHQLMTAQYGPSCNQSDTPRE